jgi:molybdopterin/thiamine biosynthesis adenylyltransferase
MLLVKSKEGKGHGTNMEYKAKAHFASPEDLSKRIPELWPLQAKTVAIFGLGCLGAPSVLEFARAGVKCIRIVDFDVVDAGTIVRWPLGFTATGQRKTDVLKSFIDANYPYTKCEPFPFKVGSVRLDSKEKSNQERIQRALSGVDLVYDCTAEVGVHQFLSDHAWHNNIPYIGVEGGIGGWAGEVYRLRPFENTGCWHCYENAYLNGTIEDLPAADENSMFQPTGCGDPTFTAAGFDMAQIALMGVRIAVSTLCEGSSDSYPIFEDDAMHIHLRNESGNLIQPKFETY